jgi:hypothetical protein
MLRFLLINEEQLGFDPIIITTSDKRFIIDELVKRTC